MSVCDENVWASILESAGGLRRASKFFHLPLLPLFEAFSFVRTFFLCSKSPSHLVFLFCSSRYKFAFFFTLLLIVLFNFSLQPPATAMPPKKLFTRKSFANLTGSLANAKGSFTSLFPAVCTPFLRCFTLPLVLIHIARLVILHMRSLGKH